MYTCIKPPDGAGIHSLYAVMSVGTDFRYSGVADPYSSGFALIPPRGENQDMVKQSSSSAGPSRLEVVEHAPADVAPELYFSDEAST